MDSIAEDMGLKCDNTTETAAKTHYCTHSTFRQAASVGGGGALNVVFQPSARKN